MNTNSSLITHQTYSFGSHWLGNKMVLVHSSHPQTYRRTCFGNLETKKYRNINEPTVTVRLICWIDLTFPLFLIPPFLIPSSSPPSLPSFLPSFLPPSLSPLPSLPLHVCLSVALTCILPFEWLLVENLHCQCKVEFFEYCCQECYPTKRWKIPMCK